METLEVTCPSGLVGVIRNLKVREANVFASRKAAKRGMVWTKVLRTVWLETVNHGIYNEPLDWRRVLQGDRFFLLIRVRQLTFPNEPYFFAVNCRSGCSRMTPFEWEVDLDDIPVQSLSQESKTHLQSDITHAFTHQLRDGTEVGFRLLTGSDDEKIQKLVERAEADEQVLSQMLAFRITRIGDQDTHFKERLAFLEDLDLDDYYDLEQAMDEADCGLETEIEVECPTCGHLQEVQLPFDRSFFAPRRRHRKRKTRT